jgi:hypothetical protein
MKQIAYVILQSHDWETEHLSYMTLKVCKQCGIKCHVYDMEGGYLSEKYFNEEGQQINSRIEPTCTLDYEKYLEALNKE